MAGPVLVIELPAVVSDETLSRLGGMLARVTDRFERPRRGEFDLNIAPERLSVAGSGRLPFVVVVNGPGFGGEDSFEADHAHCPSLPGLLGFTPAHEVVVMANSNGEGTHSMLAELTARVQEIVGGLINAEFHDDQAVTVRALPGVVSIGPDSAFGTAEFLRAWAATPGFRLVK